MMLKLMPVLSLLEMNLTMIYQLSFLKVIKARRVGLSLSSHRYSLNDSRCDLQVNCLAKLSINNNQFSFFV